MRLQVSHHSRYRYSREVTLEPHTFRFRPRTDGGQRLIDFQLRIDPEPRLVCECLDQEGNTVTQAWFETPTNHLLVHARCEVETTRHNPFGYVLTHEDVTTVPALYPENLRTQLEPYCAATELDWAVRAFSDSVANETGWDTLRFLPALSERISRVCSHEPRETGKPRASAVTLASKRGACRDLAILFVDACRAQGLAARFVSGYQMSRNNKENGEMHAWAEVFLPGGGWRGFDPTHGLAAADSLVVTAAGIRPQDAAPVSGSFRGSGVNQRFEFEIVLRDTQDQLVR